MKKALRQYWFSLDFRKAGGQKPCSVVGGEVKFYPISSKDQGRVHPFGTKVFPGKFMGYVLNAGGSSTGDLLMVNTEDPNTMPHHLLNAFSHAGRAKSCKKDSRSPPLGTERKATSGNNLIEHLQKNKKTEIQVPMLNFDMISGVLWDYPY